jgi:hypothetical protein
MYVDPRLGYTAENVDGTSIGQKLQYAQDHITRYRYNGPCFYGEFFSSGNPETYAYGHLIIHYPPQYSGEDRNLAFIFGYVSDDSTSPGMLEYTDSLGGSTYTTLVSFAGGHHVGGYKKILTYAPPVGPKGTSFSVLKFRLTNCFIQQISAYNIGERISDPDDIKITGGDCSAGMIVSATDHSLTGLLKQIGTGQTNLPTMERLTRRVFFNQTDSRGIKISDGGVAWVNLFDALEWQAKCRNLLGNDAAINCYPAAIVKVHGHITHSATIKLRYSSYAAGVNWTYTFDASDAEDTYLLLTPFGTGSSSEDGLPVYSNDHQKIVIEGMVDGNSSLTLYSWALFEGPAW